MRKAKAPTPRMQAAADEYAAAASEAGFEDATLHAHCGKPTHMYLSETGVVDMWGLVQGCWSLYMNLEVDDG